jgi:hypothetical protein
MAVPVIRNYFLVGVANANLQEFVSAGAVIISSSTSSTIRIENSGDPNDIATLDEYMATLGYTPGVPTSSNSAIITYAPLGTIAAGLSQFIGFGAVGLVEDLMNWPAPRAGTCKNLQINVPVNSLVGDAIFTVRRSVANGAFADTLIEITVVAGATGLFSSAASIAVAIGDRISLRVNTAGIVGEITFTGGLEA